MYKVELRGCVQRLRKGDEGGRWSIKWLGERLGKEVCQVVK
jgi:hypothetical protein